MNRFDVLNLADFRAELRRLIEAKNKSGVTLVAMAARNGHQPEFMRAPWDTDRFPWDWCWSTAYGLVDGVGLRLSVEFDGLPQVSTTFSEMAKKSPVFGGIGAMEFLKAAREDLGISQLDLAKTLKIVKSGVYKLENSDDPRLSSIMRYARGLGGSARYKIEEVS